MSYKTIVVHVDFDDRAALRVDFTALLALACDAHLVGLHLLPPLRLPSYTHAALGSEVIGSQQRLAEQRAAELEQMFREAMRHHGLTRSEWRSAHGDPIESMNLHARYADLLVVGQSSADERSSVPAGFAETVALTAGRPLMVIPYAGRFKPSFRHALVCWNASREATRAVTDALPLLRNTQKTTVVTFNARPSSTGHGQTPGADLALFLARHQVNAEVSNEIAHDIDIGDAIVSRAADLDADLLVMGAYGHARMRELIFGGATRSLMRQMTMPVLMSH